MPSLGATTATGVSSMVLMTTGLKSGFPCVFHPLGCKVRVPSPSLNVQNSGWCFLHKMLCCIPACAVNGSRRQCSRSAAWNPAVCSLAHPLAHGGCAKTGMHLLKQEHALLHIQAITGNAHPRGQALRRLGWKVTGKLAPFASVAHDTSFAFFLSPQICSVYLFCCNCHWNFCPG